MEEVSVGFEPIMYDEEFIDKICKLIDDSYGTNVISKYVDPGAAAKHRVTFEGSIDDIASVCIAIGVMKVNHIISRGVINYANAFKGV